MVMNTTNATRVKFTGYTLKADVSAEEIMKSIDFKNFYKIITTNDVHTVLYFKEVNSLSEETLPVLDEGARLSFVFNKELKLKRIKEEKKYLLQNQLLWEAKDNILTLSEVFGCKILRTITQLPCNHQNIPVCFTTTHRLVELLPKLVKVFHETIQVVFEDGNLVLRFSKFNACYTFPIQHCKRHDFITAEETKPDIGEITSVTELTEPENLRLNLYGSHCLNEKVSNRKDKVLIGIKGNIYVTDVNMVTIDNGKVMANKSRKIKSIGSYGTKEIDKDGILLPNSDLPPFILTTDILKKISPFFNTSNLLSVDIDIKNNSAIISNQNTNLTISCNATYLK